MYVQYSGHFYMYLCMCVRSGPPLGVTCICSFGYPGNRRKSQNLSVAFFMCFSHTWSACICMFLATLYKHPQVFNTNVLGFWGR